MQYTDGWNDGYKASREDLIEALILKAEETTDESLGFAIEWLVTMLENGELNGVVSQKRFTSTTCRHNGI